MDRLTENDLFKVRDAINKLTIPFIENRPDSLGRVKGGVLFYDDTGREIHRYVGQAVMNYGKHLINLRDIAFRLRFEKDDVKYRIDLPDIAAIIHPIGVFALSGIPNPHALVFLLSGLLKTALSGDPDFIDAIITLSDTRNLFLQYHKSG